MESGSNTEITGIIDQRSQDSIIAIGNDCVIQGYLVTEKANSKLYIGNNVFIGNDTIIDCAELIDIEADVLISYQCLLSDSDNHSLDYSIRRNDLSNWRKNAHNWSTVKSAPIRICQGAWIGARAIILKGVTIGEGAVIGAGSVVTRDIPAWSVAAGNPARVIRTLPPEQMQPKENIVQCWCDNSRCVPFSPDYGLCLNCGTLISQAGLLAEHIPVRDDSSDFYGKEYWLSHQRQDLGLPDIYARARADLPERGLYWLRTLLSYKLPPARVLELGSSHGGFVALLRWAGFDATGLDLSPWVVDFARQTFDVQMLLGDIDQQQLPDQSFDVIVLNDVLEHLPDPVGTLRRCSSLLKPDGIMLIQTPSYPDPQTYKALVRDENRFIEMLQANEHLYLFSHRAVRQLFARLGYDTLHFIPALFEYDMYFVASKQSLAIFNNDAITNSLTASPSGRMIQALIDKATEVEQLRSQVAQAAALEADVVYLKGQISTIEASQVAQQEQFNAQLAASEADRTARLQIIEQQERELGERLAASEADRSARLAVIERQGDELGRIPALEADIEYLKARLIESDNDRAGQAAVLEIVRDLLGTNKPYTYRGVISPARWKKIWNVLQAPISSAPTNNHVPTPDAQPEQSDSYVLDTYVAEEPAILPNAQAAPEMLLAQTPAELVPATDQDNAEAPPIVPETNDIDVAPPDYVAHIRDPKSTQILTYTPEIIDTIIQGLRAYGFRVEDLTLDPSEYRDYFEAAGYTTYYPTYYSFNLPEKSLEHFIATKLLDLKHNDVFIDIASEHSPVPNIYTRGFGCVSYRQDLAYAPGMNVDRIGGDAANMPVPDGFASKMALHCSFEHFEGDADIRFAREIGRVLRSGGKVSFTPIYLFHEYAILTDPAVAVSEQVPFEDDAVIYCKPGWQNRHGRFYDPAHLDSRIKSNLGDLQMTIYRITNATEIDPSCYIQFAAVISKP